MNNVPDDEIVQCPYDPNHWLRKHRLPTHLPRCERNHLNLEKVFCPFNAEHLQNKEDLEEHLKTCPDKKYAFAVENSSVTLSHSPPEFKPLPPGEDWEEASSSYNPTEHALNVPVLRSIYGVSKSERKKFKAEEHKRLQELKNQKK
ncbi:protein D7-like [Teleopsis dalmanni]|uniref:protein D7-like n=1 Tax=Teleopsis dalmanni TaxID=139649 RepID=UPI0018CD1AA1|nr:protein D7-like [Teleopsis dalmanni]